MVLLSVVVGGSIVEILRPLRTFLSGVGNRGQTDGNDLESPEQKATICYFRNKSTRCFNNRQNCLICQAKHVENRSGAVSVLLSSQFSVARPGVAG